MSLALRAVALVVCLTCSAAFGELPDVYGVVPELQLRDGRILQNVKFAAFGASTVMAKWDGGRGTIKYADLPEEYQKAMYPLRPQASPEQPRNLIPVLAFAHGPERTLNGQVFIATNGGANVKLGGVIVEIFSKPDFDQFVAWRKASGLTEAHLHLDRKNNLLNDAGSQLSVAGSDAGSEDMNARIDGANASEQQAVHEFKLYHAALFDSWDHLPQSPFASKTDADGKFRIVHDVKPPFVIFARGSRFVGGDTEDTEYYVWSVSSEAIPESGEIILDNSNKR